MTVGADQTPAHREGAVFEQGEWGDHHGFADLAVERVNEIPARSRGLDQGCAHGFQWNRTVEGPNDLSWCFGQLSTVGGFAAQKRIVR